MPEIICHHCFSRFDARRLCFKCLMHEGAPVIFPWKPGWWSSSLTGGSPPRYAQCPRDDLLTGYRVCPNPDCHRDLPYYAGRQPQRTVAVVGCRGTGKTVYLWGLLNRLQNDLAREPSPYATVLFENDASFAAYRALDLSLRVERLVPEATQAEVMKEGSSDPVIVRVLGGGRLGFCNLVLYDPAGELVENLEDVRFLRYLAGASAVIYLVDLPAPNLPPAVAEEHLRLTCMGLNAVVHQVREERRIRAAGLIPQPLAVALTKADVAVFPGGDSAGWIAGAGGKEPASAFWRGLRGWGGAARREVDAVSSRCEALLRARGYDAFVNLARHNFARVRYFAVSALGGGPDRKGFLRAGRIRPAGVENPLFWIFDNLT